MKIYTRTGDKGSTQVYADKALRVEKDDTVVQSYGDIDELNSQLGLLAAVAAPEHRESIYTIQRNLFQAGFAISASSTLTQDDVATLETDIDALSKKMPPQTDFVLPGGSKAGSIHNNGVRGRHINTGFNNGCTHQYIVSLVIEVAHHAF